MKKVVYTVACIWLLSAIFLSCEVAKSPLEVSPSGSAKGLTSSSTNSPGGIQSQGVVLGSFDVTYLGRTVDIANNRTTFSYRVTGPSVQMAFVLEVPPCANEPLVGY